MLLYIRIYTVSMMLYKTNIGKHPRFDTLIPTTTVDSVVYCCQIPNPSIMCRVYVTNSILGSVSIFIKSPINQTAISCTSNVTSAILYIRTILYINFL